MKSFQDFINEDKKNPNDAIRSRIESILYGICEHKRECIKMFYALEDNGSSDIKEASRQYKFELMSGKYHSMLGKNQKTIEIMCELFDALSYIEKRYK